MLLVPEVGHAYGGPRRLEPAHLLEAVRERARVSVAPDVHICHPADREKREQRDDGRADHTRSDAASARPLNVAWISMPGIVLSWR